jgi:CRP-like cAMP-binding protein
VGDKQQEQIFIGLPSAFSKLPEGSRKTLASRAALKNFKKNEVLVAYGQPTAPVIALRSGLVAIMHGTEEETPLVSDFLRPKDVYAESTRANTVSRGQLTAMSTSSAVVFPVDAFREVLLTQPTFGVWFLNESERRLADQYQHRTRNALMSDEGRFAYFLWSISEEIGVDRRVVRVKVAEKFIASYLGVAREQVNRKKQLLEKTGHILQTDEGIELMPSLPALFSFEVSTPLPGEQPFHAAFSDMFRIGY